MDKKKRAAIIKKHLDLLFPEPTPPLNHLNAFTLLIAVLLSARCTDKKVNEVTPELFALATTPQEMAKLSYEEIRSIIKPIGLSPTKAKNIKALSTILIDEYKSQVPSTLEELETLPGVGHKTASVVLCQWFHKPAFPIDTHIHRCAKRWGLSSGKNVKITEEDLKKLFPKNSWEKLHLQIIYYARMYCRAAPHKIENCPICRELS